MTLIDLIILFIVFVLVSFVTYFGLVKPAVIKKRTGSYGCASCPMAYDSKLKRALKKYKKSKLKQ